jgi:hypothetical protein
MGGQFTLSPENPLWANDELLGPARGDAAE